jgi:hypothetical protein
MRVPIYAADLLDKRGFQRIAKKLQRNWPSTTPLSLASAREILSGGLGYRDYLDVQRSSEKIDLDAPVPTQSEVWDGICTSIFTYSRSGKIIDIGEDDLIRLVTLLPLQELSAFGSFGVGQTITEEEPLKPSEDTRKQSTAVPHQPVIEDARKSGSANFKAKFSSQPLKLLSGQELKSILDIVRRKGSLRDQCLLSALLQGVRSSEITAAKPRDISQVNSKVHLRLRASRASVREINLLLPSSFGVLVKRYIQKAGLSKDDYLFPSAADATSPMRSDEVNNILSSYGREALGAAIQISGHKLRLSVFANIMKVRSPSSSMGHISHTPLPYLAKWYKKSKD